MEDNYSVTIDGKKNIVLGTFEELENFCSLIYARNTEIRKAKRSEMVLMRILNKDIPLFENWKTGFE